MTFSDILFYLMILPFVFSGIVTGAFLIGFILMTAVTMCNALIDFLFGCKKAHREPESRQQ